MSGTDPSVTSGGWRRRRLPLAAAAVTLAAVALLAWYGSRQEACLFALDAHGGRVAWSAASGDRMLAAAAGPQERVYAWSAARSPDGGIAGVRLLAFDAGSGRRLWSYAPDWAAFPGAVPERSARLRPYPAPGRVYLVLAAGEGESTLVALDAAGGRPLWSVRGVLDPAPGEEPAVLAAGEAVVAAGLEPGGRTVRLSALARADGRLRWRASVPLGRRLTIPEVVDQPFLANDGRTLWYGPDGTLASFDLATGAPLATRRGVAGTQLGLRGGTLYRSSPSALEALDPVTGSSRWRYTRPPAPGGALRRFALGDGAVFAVGAEAGGIWLDAVDATDGRERWRTQAATAPGDTLYLHAPAAVRDAVLVATGSGAGDRTVTARSPATGAVRWRFVTRGGGDVAAAGGRAFVTDLGPRWRHWLARVNPAWNA
ncbi:MAG TPA: PQQ-binding-like beta-propeller repeat protein [Actinomycetes bacterium]|nr:PQQ-binding-like beta-propeller repeat protein [Actinomycetes bacterium]